MLIILSANALFLVGSCHTHVHWLGRPPASFSQLFREAVTLQPRLLDAVPPSMLNLLFFMAWCAGSCLDSVESGQWGLEHGSSR